MASIPSLLAATFFATRSVVVGGDPYQLPPIYPEDADEPNPWFDAWLRRDITGYTVADVYSRVFRRFGFEAEVNAMQKAWQHGARERAMQQISDPMVEALSVIGTEAQCQAHIRRFVASGVDLPIVMPFSHDAHQASYLRTITAFQAKGAP